MPESHVPSNAEAAPEARVRRRAWRGHPAIVPAVIASGGALGALARHGLSVAFPHTPDEMPWATLSINASGCLLIGVVMVLFTEAWPDQRLLRPFVGVGVLGGYTTFSTYTVDIRHAIAANAPGTALVYLGLTIAGAMLAVVAGSVLTRALLRPALGNRRRS